MTVAELVALNEEIAALVRAGSPLEAGLGRTSGELPGRLRGVAAALADRMKRGQSLVEALDAEGAAIPPLYRAVVEAGARTGDVSAALGGMSRYLRGFAEARDAVGLALWYPLVVASLAYALFLGVVVVLAPRFGEAFASLGLPTTRALALVESIGRTAWIWWPIWPIVLAAVAAAWFRSGRASRLDASSWTFLGLFPWMRSLVRDYQSAGFAELLALLLENRVAYPKAVALAAEATGNAALIAEARTLAAALESGSSAERAIAGGVFRSFAPMLRWVLAHGHSEGSLVHSLRNLAPMYRSRATYKADKLRVLLPSILILVVGMTATLLYAFTLFLPLSGMMNELAGP
ncbi:type II secretion system F family protein [Paludisphaera soli]|uniref:type II secretion system F family protein n=1 Tax=Paludisphaera soli TaxID=2712865 RepID=UPI0013ED4859|nr:type II secretion system F family protein [Paludisphaera soli]